MTWIQDLTATKKDGYIIFHVVSEHLATTLLLTSPHHRSFYLNESNICADRVYQDDLWQVRVIITLSLSLDE